MEGRHVHPSTLYPGGVGTVATIQLFTDYYTRLMRYVEFMKRVVPMHDDLFDFMYEALPGYEEVGRRRVLLGCWGAFNDPDHCDFQYRNDDRLGPQDVRHPRRGGRRQARHQRPGRDQPRHPDPARALVLPRLGGPGDVRHARPAGQPGRPAPPVEPAHDPGAAEARLRRQVLLDDVAALVRRQGPPARSTPAAARSPGCGPTALAGLVDIGVHQGHRHSVQINLPRTILKPEASFEWKMPGRQEGRAALQRDRAQPGPHLLPGLRGRRARCTSSRRRSPRCAAGNTKTWEKFRCPDEAISVGFTEAVRGVLSHHMVIRGGKIANYHPYPPTPWNGSVRDSFGTPGPYEDAVQNTPIFEESRSENFKGIDIMRAVRSFDPCLPCGVHMYKGDGEDRCTSCTSPGMLNIDLTWRARIWTRRARRTHRGAPRRHRRDRRAAVAHAAEELVRVLMRFYGAGLEQMVTIIRAGAGDAMRCTGSRPTRWSAGLLALHDLHPVPSAHARRARAGGGAAQARSHGGGVELVGIDDDGTVRVALGGERLRRRHGQGRRRRRGDRPSWRRTSRASRSTPRPAEARRCCRSGCGRRRDLGSAPLPRRSRSRSRRSAASCARRRCRRAPAPGAA